MSDEKHSKQPASRFSSGDTTALLELLGFCYPLNDQQDKRALEQTALIKRLHALPTPSQPSSLCEQLQQYLQPTEAPQPEHYSQLRFIDALFELYQKHTVFDQAIGLEVRRLLPLLAICQIQQPHWSWDWNHPLLKILALIQNHFIGWSKNQGKAGDRAITSLGEQLQNIHQLWLTDQREDLLNKLASQLSSEQQRSIKLEQRIKDTEIGALRAQRSYQLTAKLLNEKMSGKQLPAAISDFLQTHWRESLRLHLLQNSEHSSEWLRLKKLTETFIWSFQPFDNENQQQQQRIYQLIPQLQSELQAATISLTHRPQELQQQLTLIENQHLYILKAQPLSYQSFLLIDDNDPLLAQTTTMSSGLLKHVTRLNEGQWFLHQQNNQRIKLILKLDDAQQLLFIHRSGMKAGQYNFEEFAYMLSSQQILTLKQSEPLSQYANHLVQKLDQHRQQKIETQQRRDSAQQQQRERETKLREQARLKALAEAKQLADEQAKQKQRQQQACEAAEQARRQAAAAAQQHAEDQHLDAMQQQLDSLNIGARIRFFNDLGDSQDCKLAVKLQTSGKYIFTDASGLKAKECLQPELLNMLLDGSAEIINAGIGFEDTLAKVVNGLRKK